MDYMSGVVGVKLYDGSRASVWGSIAGGLLGLFALGPAGIIIGPFLGAVAGELISRCPLEQAVKVGLGTLLGFAGGATVKILLKLA